MCKVIVDIRVEIEVEQDDLLCCEDFLEFARDSRREIAALCSNDDFEILSTRVEWDKEPLVRQGWVSKISSFFVRVYGI